MLPAELIRALYTNSWPGNVRELQNVLQRYLATRDLGAVLPSLGDSSWSDTLHTEAPPIGMALPDAVEAYEKRVIAHALVQTGHHVGKTGELLGIPRRTLTRKISAYQLRHKNKP